MLLGYVDGCYLHMSYLDTGEPAECQAVQQRGTRARIPGPLRRGAQVLPGGRDGPGGRHRSAHQRGQNLQQPEAVLRRRAGVPQGEGWGPPPSLGGRGSDGDLCRYGMIHSSE